MTAPLKSKELTALKQLASANIDAALFAAVRIGAGISDDAAKTIKRAVDALELEAESLKACHTIDGNWGNDTAAKTSYAEFKALAKSLRGIVEVKE